MFWFWNLWAASVLRTFSVSTNIRTFKAISNPSFLTSISPESDTRVGEEAKQEASSDARQEGGGQHNITSQSQSSPQCHTPGIHVDGAGRLLHHALHPTAAVHLHLQMMRKDWNIFFMTQKTWGCSVARLTFNTSKPIGRFSPFPFFLHILLSSCCRQISTSSSLARTSNMNW